MISQASVRSHLWGGGGIPHPRSGQGGTLPDGGHPRCGRGGGCPIPGVHGGGTLSEVWMGGTPSQVQMGGSTPSQVWMWGGNPGTPPGSRLDWVPPWLRLDWMGYPPPPQSKTGWVPPPPSRTEWGTPLPQSRLGGVPPCPGLNVPPPVQDWMGYLPFTSSRDRSAKWTLATRRAVCLLRSRRRTFLLKQLFYKLFCPLWQKWGKWPNKWYNITWVTL